MSSGLDYARRLSADGEDPNANVFKEAGWELNVDETVVRTDGEQFITSTKHWHENGIIMMEDTASIVQHPGSWHTFHDDAHLTLQKNARQYVLNKSEFLFEDLDWIGDAP